MRVSSNTLSENLIRQIQLLGSQQTRLQTQVATGQRIFQPEDDPASVGRVLALESEQRENSQFFRNIDRALEVSQISFAGLQNLKSASDRATEIGVLGAGPLGSDAARAYGAEVDQLIEHTLQVANTKLRNDYVFAGTATDAAPFTATRNGAGKVTGVTYGGNASQAEIQLSESSNIARHEWHDQCRHRQLSEPARRAARRAERKFGAGRDGGADRPARERGHTRFRDRRDRRRADAD
jgi:flagellar hook-associated protein 3 FlgL